MRDFLCAEKKERGMRGFHCLMSSMPVESGDDVRKSLEQQQQDSIHKAIITLQHQS